MSIIQDKIKELQKQQTKIELLQAFGKSLKKFEDQDKYKDILVDLLKDVNKFIDSKIKTIESGQTLPEVPTLTIEEIQALKELYQGLKKRANKEPGHKTIPLTQQNNNVPIDPLAFSLQYKHLENKVVKVTTDTETVEATVVGAQAPNLVVVLNNGTKTLVSPSNIIE